MEYKNDERYWNIKLLNKWFAISSILFLFSFMWMFYHDNDDQFKRYQREFRKLEAQVTAQQLEDALSEVKDERIQFENQYQIEFLQQSQATWILQKLMLKISLKDI